MKPLIAWVSNREVDMLKIFHVAAREIKLAMLPTSWDGLQHMPRSLVRICQKHNTIADH
jgi:6-phosphogluconolactonase (cycloisomerase 2 family)